MELRLSIIIPFYNVEHYISECLDSVFDQDIPLSEYEVICVNDGSPDKSREIVLDYMKRYPNLRLVEHEKNRKLGTARNTGRAIARGQYIWNVDSDDKIVSNCLHEMLQTCEENDLDILEFGAIQFNRGNQRVLPHIPSTNCVMTGLDYMEQLTPFEVSRMCPIWRKMIRLRFLEDEQVFSPEINMGEDIPFSFRALMLARRMFVSSSNYYLYRTNDDSLTGTNWIPSANSLYEKCIVNARLVFEVSKEVPPSHKKVQHSFLESAKYTLNLFPQFLKGMDKKGQHSFRAMCRKSVFNNWFVFSLFSKKKAFGYFLWLIGLSGLSQ